MSKKRAFVRYSKQGKIVPGSLILTAGSHPNGPSTWKEVPADLCCDGGGTVQLNISNAVEGDLPSFLVGTIVLIISCEFDVQPFQTIQYSANVTGDQIPPPINTVTDLFNFLNLYFNYPGFTWILTESSTIDVVINTNLLTNGCQNPVNAQFNYFPSA